MRGIKEKSKRNSQQILPGSGKRNGGTMGIRTPKQNKSLHKGCQLLADKLNDAGLDMKKTLKPWVDIPWTGDSVRVFMFNSIASIMFDGKTSHELDTVEIQEVWKVLNRHLAEQHSIEQEWPDRHGE